MRAKEEIADYGGYYDNAKPLNQSWLEKSLVTTDRLMV